METLADAYLRATRAVRAAPTHVERFMLEALAEDAVVSDLLQRNVREPAARAVPADAELTAIDAAVLRALVAETVVEFRWAVHIGRTDQRLPPLGPEDRGRAIACWAADVIVRRRVEVRPLEAEPTAASCADWLEAFSTALTLALARAEMVRVPAPIIGGALDARAGDFTALRSPSAAEKVLDRTGQTFSAGDLALWRLTPPRWHQLSLSLDLLFEGDPRKLPRGARTVLSGPYLRAYLACWALTDRTTDQLGENPQGLFAMDAGFVLLDLYGHKPETEKKRPNVRRPPRTAERMLEQEFQALRDTVLNGIGDWVPEGPPQALILPHRNAADGRRFYFHHPLAMALLRKYFIQVPRAVLRLSSDDTPLALGVARILLQHRAAFRGPGHWRCSLDAIAREAGDPIAEARRSLGATKYYRTLAERLQRVVHDGALGEVRVEGEGPDALVTLTPSDALGTVYGSIADVRPVPEADTDAKLAKLPRRTGRPRKGPLA